MIGCDPRPGYPLDRTVRGDRRLRDPFRPAPPWPAQAADRCRAGLPGRGAGAAGRPQRASLAADVLRPAGPPVPVPAEPARLPQAAEGGRAAAGRGDGSPGPPVAVLVRPGAADRCHPGAVRRLPGDRQALRPGRVGALRLLRRAFALVLGAEAVPDHHPGRDARGLVPGRPQARRARGRRRPAGPRRPHRRAAAGPDPDRRQGLRGPRVRGPGHFRVRAAPGPPGPPRRGTPARVGQLDPAVDRVGQRHPQRVRCALRVLLLRGSRRVQFGRVLPGYEGRCGARGGRARRRVRRVGPCAKRSAGRRRGRRRLAAVPASPLGRVR
jgi:hypothetical protein